MMYKLRSFLEKYKTAVGGSFFLVIIILGFLVYKDYGLSWDEPISHMNGKVSLDYITDSDPYLWEYSERYYGVLIEVPLVWLQKILSIDSTQEIFFMRHIATYLIFIIGLFFFYLLCMRRFRSWWIGLLGAVFLFLSPRIFADSFYNSKDLPLLVAFIASVYTLSNFLNKPSWKNISLHALTTAIAIAIRVPGIFIIGITIIMMGLDIVFIREVRTIWKKYLALLSGYFVFLILLTVALWPFLWQDPYSHFLEAFSDMSKFSRQLSMQVLYMGDFISASKIPWHYIPVWILISTPIIYLILFFFGIWSMLKKAIGGVNTFYINNRTDIIVIGWFLGPIITVVLFSSVLYDGWRHLYFIYPALIYISLIGFKEIYLIIKNKNKETRYWSYGVFGIIVSVGIISTGLFMIVNHPYQNVYFNFISGGMKESRENFDLDYWGLSFREGLEYIAKQDKNKIIPILFVGGTPDNLYILASDIAERFEIVSQNEISKAKYVISNYRWQQYKKLPLELEIFSVKVEGESILSVFKVK